MVQHSRTLVQEKIGKTKRVSQVVSLTENMSFVNYYQMNNNLYRPLLMYVIYDLDWLFRNHKKDKEVSVVSYFSWDVSIRDVDYIRIRINQDIQGTCSGVRPSNVYWGIGLLIRPRTNPHGRESPLVLVFSVHPTDSLPPIGNRTECNMFRKGSWMRKSKCF